MEACLDILNIFGISFCRGAVAFSNLAEGPATLITSKTNLLGSCFKKPKWQRLSKRSTGRLKKLAAM